MREKTGKIEISRIEQLVPTFAADDAIVLAFLFGSYAHGQGNALSDVDIALVLSSSVPPGNYLDYRLRYFSEVSKVLHDDRVDVIILNHAPPLLAHEAITGARLIRAIA
jgi:predicted nucleotidyltransferase